MKKIFLITLILCVGCSCHRSKEHLKHTVNLCSYKPNRCRCNLFVEVYTVFGMGAFGSDLNSKYLTDSVNFRIFLGTYDDYDEMIITKCNGGDSVIITKTKKTSSMPEWDIPKILESKTYSLKDLKKQHKFE